jgi:hypothetical protein
MSVPGCSELFLLQQKASVIVELNGYRRKKISYWDGWEDTR